MGEMMPTPAPTNGGTATPQQIVDGKGLQPHGVKEVEGGRHTASANWVRAGTPPLNANLKIFSAAATSGAAQSPQTLALEAKVRELEQEIAVLRANGITALAAPKSSTVPSEEAPGTVPSAPQLSNG